MFRVLKQLGSPIITFTRQDCRCLATRIPQKRFRHIYREANKCADCLASIGSLLDSDFAVFSSPPVDLLSFLEADATGLFVHRLCTESLLVV
uniref:RNase H type-1 domain-containing protein n=1 Tax=Quercus lobata TaxID=97700 RepID=A0A7N2REC1_QUELO